MRGYFTFVVVFAAYLLLISLAQFNTNAKTSNLGSAIWVERYYQVQMNAKEAVVEASREGAKEGFADYFGRYITECVVAKAAAGNPPDPPNFDCLKKSINKKSIDKISMLDKKDFEGLLVSVTISPPYDYEECMSPCVRSTATGELVVKPSIDPSFLPQQASDYSADEIGDYSQALTSIEIDGKKIHVSISNEGTGWQDADFDMPVVTEEMP